MVDDEIGRHLLSAFEIAQRDDVKMQSIRICFDPDGVAYRLVDRSNELIPENLWKSMRDKEIEYLLLEQNRSKLFSSTTDERVDQMTSPGGCEVSSPIFADNIDQISPVGINISPVIADENDDIIVAHDLIDQIISPGAYEVSSPGDMNQISVGINISPIVADVNDNLPTIGYDMSPCSQSVVDENPPIPEYVTSSLYDDVMVDNSKPMSGISSAVAVDDSYAPVNNNNAPVVQAVNPCNGVMDVSFKYSFSPSQSQNMSDVAVCSTVTEVPPAQGMCADVPAAYSATNDASQKTLSIERCVSPNIGKCSTGEVHVTVDASNGVFPVSTESYICDEDCIAMIDLYSSHGGSSSHPTHLTDAVGEPPDKEKCGSSAVVGSHDPLQLAHWPPHLVNRVYVIQLPSEDVIESALAAHNSLSGDVGDPLLSFSVTSEVVLRGHGHDPAQPSTRGTIVYWTYFSHRVQHNAALDLAYWVAATLHLELRIMVCLEQHIDKDVQSYTHFLSKKRKCSRGQPFEYEANPFNMCGPAVRKTFHKLAAIACYRNNLKSWLQEKQSDSSTSPRVLFDIFYSDECVSVAGLGVVDSGVGEAVVRYCAQVKAVQLLTDDTLHPHHHHAVSHIAKQHPSLVVLLVNTTGVVPVRHIHMNAQYAGAGDAGLSALPRHLNIADQSNQPYLDWKILFRQWVKTNAAMSSCVICGSSPLPHDSHVDSMENNGMVAEQSRFAWDNVTGSIPNDLLCSGVVRRPYAWQVPDAAQGELHRVRTEVMSNLDKGHYVLSENYALLVLSCLECQLLSMVHTAAASVKSVKTDVQQLTCLLLECIRYGTLEAALVLTRVWCVASHIADQGVVGDDSPEPVRYWVVNEWYAGLEEHVCRLDWLRFQWLREAADSTGSSAADSTVDWLSKCGATLCASDVTLNAHTHEGTARGATVGAGGQVVLMREVRTSYPVFNSWTTPYESMHGTTKDHRFNGLHRNLLEHGQEPASYSGSQHIDAGASASGSDLVYWLQTNCANRSLSGAIEQDDGERKVYKVPLCVIREIFLEYLTFSKYDARQCVLMPILFGFALDQLELR